MARFKPQASYITKESRNDYFNGRRKSMVITKCFDTYREFLKEVKEICESNIELEGVFIVRSKRGQFGEWFERWELDSKGDPYIMREGWS